MFLLNTLAEADPDYFHISANSYKRTSIVDTADKEPLITKYLRQRSDKLAEIPIMGVGSIAQRSDAEDALELGYDLVSVGKAYLVELHWAAKAEKMKNRRLRRYS